MNSILTDFGVPARVQAFFDVNELLFNYGGHFEHFAPGYHRVPTTGNLWLAGKDLSREVIITASAMDAIAYLTLNHTRYPDLEMLAFIALGNLPRPAQLSWMRANYPKRKFCLAFGNDLLGRLVDIRVAAGLHGKTVGLLRLGDEIQITCNGKVLVFPQESLSLSVFEKATGLRTGIRTSKPKSFDTYLDQLKYYANP